VQKNHGVKSEFLSMQSPRNKFMPSGRKIAIFLLDGFSAPVVLELQAEILAISSIPVIVGPRKGNMTNGTSNSLSLATQFTFETCRSVFFDALFFAGAAGENPHYEELMMKNGLMTHAAREAYKHFKTIGAGGSAVAWLRGKALPGVIPRGEKGKGGVDLEAPGIVLCESDTEADVSAFTETFLAEVAKHRAWDRDVSDIAA
jgi:catalase